MEKALQLQNFNFPINSLDSYIAQVNRIPLLTKSEEEALARRLFTDGDLEAARQLVLAHLRYVVRVAKGYLGYGLPLNDLIQEGNVGLMKAVRRFDPNVGVRLVTFAMHWIKAEIHEYVIRNWRIVKVATTKAQRKLFFNLRQMRKHLGWLSMSEIQEVAKDLKVKPETVREMEARMSSMDMPFEHHGNDDDGEAHFSPAGFLEDNRYNPERQLVKSDLADQSQTLLLEAMEKLDDRSQDILKARWLNENKTTLQELADKYQVSAERIRQLEKNAMVKLKEALKDVA